MKLNNLLINLWQDIKHSLISQSEPQIKQKSDRDGNLYWQVRDRQTNQSYSFGSESEVIAWIEQRYHRA